MITCTSARTSLPHFGKKQKDKRKLVKSILVGPAQGAAYNLEKTAEVLTRMIQEDSEVQFRRRGHVQGMLEDMGTFDGETIPVLAKLLQVDEDSNEARLFKHDKPYLEPYKSFIKEFTKTRILKTQLNPTTLYELVSVFLSRIGQHPCLKKDERTIVGRLVGRVYNLGGEARQNLLAVNGIKGHQPSNKRP